MKYDKLTFETYLESLAADRKESMKTLRNTILKHLPEGFEESIDSFGLHYEVPLAMYPSGYHCTPGKPLPFISVASQKNFIAIYHLGIYADPALLNWFVEAYPNHVSTKLDMGKSCIRFKKMNTIPMDLLATLCEKTTPKAWIENYEKLYKK
jgi:hypothetical protein